MSIKLPPNLTVDTVLEAAKSQMFGLENPGFCLSCGAEHYECEPDARRYECEECGERNVYGAAEIIMMIA